MDLLYEIAHCPNVQQCYNASQATHPCSKIISVQKAANAKTLAQYQVPEPWNGDIQSAPILFFSSNPSIDQNQVIEKREEFPTESWSDELIADFFTHRFSGGLQQWTESRKTLLLDGSYSSKPVSFWSSVRKRAGELLQREVEDGVDYALSEVVHCKSKSQIGVEEAVSECASRYLRRVIEFSGAKVVVVLGKHAEKAVKKEFDFADENMIGPLLIGKLQRYLVFLPHPAAFIPRTFEECLAKERIQVLRDFLHT